MNPKVHQIHIKPRLPGQRGIPKRPVDSVRVTLLGAEGDYNRWRHEKGENDPHQAILLMPLETLEELSREGWLVHPGDLGENFTTVGLPYPSFRPGQSYRLGAEVEIEISKPCLPCSNLKVLNYIGEARVQAFIRALKDRRGWYASVSRGGWVFSHDEIERIEPDR